MWHAALSAELESELRPGHGDVSASECREPERAIVPGVLVAAHANQRLLEQPDDRREHLLTRQRRCRDVLLHALTDARQHFAEVHQPAELRVVANRAIPRVVAILLSSARIARRDLQVAARRRADPHVRPSWRDHELADALELRRVAYRRAIGPRVRKASPTPPASNPGGVVRHVSKACGFRRLHVLIGETHRRAATLRGAASRTAWPDTAETRA